MIRTLQEKVLTTDANVYMETTVTKLFKDASGRVVGALAYTRESGSFVHFKTKAVIMATGGWGRIFKVTSNSWEGTGDGVRPRLRRRGGARGHGDGAVPPHGMVWPPGVRGILVTEGVRGEGGILRNAEGERYMERYDPRRWSSVRATWWPGPTTPRSRRAAAASTAACTWTSRTSATTAS